MIYITIGTLVFCALAALRLSAKGTFSSAWRNAKTLGVKRPQDLPEANWLAAMQTAESDPQQTCRSNQPIAGSNPAALTHSSARPAPPNIPTTPPRDFLHAASGRADAISSTQAADSDASATLGNRMVLPESESKMAVSGSRSAKMHPAPTFPARPTSTPRGAGLRGAASGAELERHRLANSQKVVCMTCKAHMRGPLVGPVTHSICPACKADYTSKVRELAAR